MIRLTRLNQSEIIMNSDLIEHIEIGANTVVTLTDGNSFVVQESPEEIVDRVVQFKRHIHEGRGATIVKRLGE
jgi:flagellar protein FlbD